MKVYNIQRKTAEDYDRWIDPEENCWITIQEPGTKHIMNWSLSECPTLELSFFDLVKPMQGFELGEYFYPPSEEDARKTVEFLLENKGKNVIVNCKAGISRSGAIAQFCVDYLGYEWDAESEKRAVPNKLLYDLMAKCYGKPKKVKIIDKRRNYE